MSDFLTSYTSDFEKGISFFIRELSSISAGRANPSTIEDIPIAVYESTMTLKELASITIPEPRELLVQPWDKATIKNIIGGLQSAQLDMQIIGDASTVRLIVPQLTEESRKKLVKIVSEKIEQAKVRTRQIRDKVKETILKEEKQKNISEDEKFNLLKELDEMTQRFVKEIESLGTKKRDELLTV